MDEAGKLTRIQTVVYLVGKYASTILNHAALGTRKLHQATEYSKNIRRPAIEFIENANSQNIPTLCLDLVGFVFVLFSFRLPFSLCALRSIIS